jgi:Isochorismatase family
MRSPAQWPPHRSTAFRPSPSTTSAHGAPGVGARRRARVLPELAREEGDIVVVKHRYRGFFETELATIQRQHRIESLVFTGCTTSVCVDSALRDAFYRDYRCLLLSDVEAPRLRELVDVYLARHDGEPERIAKLRWLLAKAVSLFGDSRISHLRPAEIAAWRMTIPGRASLRGDTGAPTGAHARVSWVSLMRIRRRVSTARSAGEPSSDRSSPG